jgi:hypothetical protein
VTDIPAHDQTFTHRYVVHYPDHSPRESDPHYKDFNEYHHKTRATAKCYFADQIGDDSGCDHENPLELHHAHIEFALQNAVDLTLLEKAYPGVSNPEELGAWVESAANLIWLCRFHHRGAGGVHNASASDYEAEKFIKNLISENTEPTK